VSGGQRSFAPIGVHLGEDWQVACHAHNWSTPILVISAGSASVDITIAGRDSMPASGVEFARELVRQAERFAVECERLHAAQASHGQDSTENPGPGRGAGDRGRNTVNGGTAWS
jgi:hypothetical protein